jgi:iron(III) transport system ATP-binding protein
MIQVEGIGVHREKWVFRNVTFSLKEGDLVGIIGSSGAGKTTLLKSISGLLDIVEGSVSLDGAPLLGPSEKLVPGYEDIQLVNQDYALDLFHTVEENIREKVLHLPKKDQHILIEEMLDLLELGSLRTRQARWLSGGEQQRLAIARALACEPRFLLLDEPFVHVDQRLRLKIMRYLKELNTIRKTAIVLVSHDGAEMMGFVDSIMHLANGGIKRIAPAHEMYYHPDSLIQGELMGIINCVEIEGEEVLFRPSAYSLKAPNLKLNFQNSFNSGLLVFNYFKTENEKEVVLTSNASMDKVTAIRIESLL